LSIVKLSIKYSLIITYIIKNNIKTIDNAINSLLFLKLLVLVIFI